MAAEAELTSLRHMIEAEDDVRRVVHLERQGARFRYMIETPFKTFPKFVIGTTDGDFKDVRIQHRCGLIETAENAWKGKAADDA